MNSPQEAVEALCRLDAADRDWILAALSANARQRLRELAADHRAESGSQDAQRPRLSAEISAERSLVDAAPALVVSRLGSESAWALALVLSVRTWPWQEALLTALPPDKRLEVARLRTRLPRASSRMREALLRALSEQVCSVAAGADGNVPFEQALSRARLRTGRRGRNLEIAR